MELGEDKIGGHVAVVTRTKDRPVFLERALEDISAQAFGDLVWVVVNDGGSTESVNLIAEQARARGIKTVAIHLSETKGMEAASNVGINSVRSDYIAIHDDDDTWSPEFLKKMVSLLDADERLSSAISWTWVVKERLQNGTISPLNKRPFQKDPTNIYVADLFFANIFPPISHLIRRSALERVGPFDDSFPVLGDWEFNIRLALDGEIGVLPERLAFYHVRDIADAKDVNANTTVAKVTDHRRQDALFRNAMLRKMVRQNPDIVGLLLSLHRMSYFQMIMNRGGGPVRAALSHFGRLFSR